MLKVHPLRAELEILEYGRDYLEVRHADKHSVRSIPILIFIDVFGIHRNMYRALKAFYTILAALPYSEQGRVVNYLTLTLGSHGADMSRCQPADGSQYGLIVGPISEADRSI